MEQDHGRPDATDRNGKGAARRARRRATRRGAQGLPRHIRSSWGGTDTPTAAAAAETSGIPANLSVRRASWLQPAQNLAQLQNHLRRSLDPVRRAHQHIERTETLLLEAKRLADRAFDAIALDC